MRNNEGRKEKQARGTGKNWTIRNYCYKTINTKSQRELNDITARLIEVEKTKERERER